MHIITIDQLTINHAGRLIFEGLNWAIGDRDRIGLVGPNGAGKSSLLKAIIGEVTPDFGTIHFIGPVTIGYLAQQIELPLGQTLLNTALEPPPQLAAVETQLARYEAQLSDPAIYSDEKKLARVLAQQEAALIEYDRLGGPRHESQVRGILAHLGFTEADYDLPTDTLSGGQKKLVVLTRLAAAGPAVLLMDEPDNHLDLDAKQRLESFIKGYPGAVVIVSHDRYLLDESVTHIAELEDGKLTSYVGNYTAYATERELRRLKQQQMYVAQQKRIQQIEAAIHEWEMKARADLNERHARQAHSRRRMLERMEENGDMIEKVVDRRLMEAQFDGWQAAPKRWKSSIWRWASRMICCSWA